MARTLVKTETAGWFLDANNIDGGKVRKTDGDRIIDREEFEQMKTLTDPEPTPEPETNGSPTAEQVEQAQAQKDAEAKATRDAVKAERAKRNENKPAPVKTTLSSGKEAIGPTVVIQSAWVDAENRTKAQQKLFETGDPRKITFDAVKKAAGNEPKAQPSGKERVIKKQDEFQVRFTHEEQRKWRNELRRRATKRRQAAKAKAKQ